MALHFGRKKDRLIFINDLLIKIAGSANKRINKVKLVFSEELLLTAVFFLFLSNQPLVLFSLPYNNYLLHQNK
jgi:hypothetical protein